MPAFDFRFLALKEELFHSLRIRVAQRDQVWRVVTLVELEH